jgi:hypothetical protein
MTDPTPEDARSTYDRALTECQKAIPEATAPCSVCVNHIATQERCAAVAAERERCLGLVGEFDNRLEVCAAIRGGEDD